MDDGGKELLNGTDVHIHFPAGAVPKDGPSAGVTIVSALVSLLRGELCRSDTAMTGEVTLRGNVLPVGGIKEKVIAAHRAGLKRVILPEKNRKDLVELPERVREDMEFLFVSDVKDAVDHALCKPDTRPAEQSGFRPRPVLVPRPDDQGVPDGVNAGRSGSVASADGGQRCGALASR